MSKGFKLAIGGVIGLLIIVFILRGCESCNKTPQVVATNGDSTQYWKNRHGEVVASMKKQEEDFAETTLSLSEIASDAETKVKYLQDALRVTQKGEVIIKVPGPPVYIKGKDSIIYESTDGAPLPDAVGQHFENPYYTADVVISLTGDSSRLHLTTYDTLTAVTKTVREGGFLNRKTFLQIDVTNKNPHNKITGLQVYRKELPGPKRFGVGIQAGFGYSKGFQPAPYVGIGLSFNIVRL